MRVYATVVSTVVHLDKLMAQTLVARWDCEKVDLKVVELGFWLADLKVVE